MFLTARPTADFAPESDAEAAASISSQTARSYLDQIVQYGAPATGEFVQIGTAGAVLLGEAARRGYRVRGAKSNEDPGLPDAAFDVCACVGEIGRVPDPVAFLNRVHRLLKPGGVLFLVTPDADGRCDSPLDSASFDTRGRQLQYFSRSTILNVLARTFFKEVELSADRSGPAGGVTVIARAAPERRQPLLSVIVPAYNEATTIRGALDRLIAKQVPGLDKEVIVVEGNSTDGTREAVLEYRDRPGVHIVLTDRPRGKGHAVRQGLNRAAGDFVLIQDADDEYDIDDYEALLEPLRSFRQAFVLGTRHQGHWRIRNFGKPSSLTVFMNSGHVLLTEFFNLLYRQTLTDPWTMYKVFRRDCLYRVKLECNRFDFDVELVAKLVRRGFKPLEIPVRYHSRSFDEGKKIRVFRDPFTWLWACLKYRLVSFRS